MALSFLNPTSSRVRMTPVWYGPVLPRVTNRGAPLALVNPFVTSDPKTPGPIFPAAPSYHASIVSSLDMLFGTRPGERLFLPMYGLNMEALVFEALDEQMTADAQTALRSAIETYEPRVRVTQVQIVRTNIQAVQVTASPDATNNQVSFVITMQIRGSTPNDLLTYSTPSIPSA